MLKALQNIVHCAPFVRLPLEYSIDISQGINHVVCLSWFAMNTNYLYFWYCILRNKVMLPPEMDYSINDNIYQWNNNCFSQKYIQCGMFIKIQWQRLLLYYSDTGSIRDECTLHIILTWNIHFICIISIWNVFINAGKNVNDYWLPYYNCQPV